MKSGSIVFAMLLAASGGANATDLLQTYRAAQANDPVIAAARAAQQAGAKRRGWGRGLRRQTRQAMIGNR